jgi:hypothetical protein
MLALKLEVSSADLQILTDWAARQWRTPGGQASFLLHQLIEQHKNGKVQAAPSMSSVLGSPSKPLEWETGK